MCQSLCQAQSAHVFYHNQWLEVDHLSKLKDGSRHVLALFLQVLRCLRMDRVTVGITRYVIAKMGDKYVQPPTLDYSAIYRQSTQMTPIVFVLSPGADPAFDVFKLGRQLTNDQVLLSCVHQHM